MEIMFDFMC